MTKQKYFTRYEIVNGSDTRRLTAQADLATKVLAYLEEGWIPLGGVVYLGTETVSGFTCHVFCQAMARPHEVDEDWGGG